MEVNLCIIYRRTWLTFYQRSGTLLTYSKTNIEDPAKKLERRDGLLRGTEVPDDESNWFRSLFIVTGHPLSESSVEYKGFWTGGSQNTGFLMADRCKTFSVSQVKRLYGSLYKICIKLWQLYEWSVVVGDSMLGPHYLLFRVLVEVV